MGFHLDSIDFRRRVQKPLYRTLVSQDDEFGLSKWFSCLVEHGLASWLVKCESCTFQAFDPFTMTVQRLPTANCRLIGFSFPNRWAFHQVSQPVQPKTHKKHTPGQFKPANIQKNLTFLVYVGLENPPFPVCQWKWRFSLGIPHKKYQKILVVICYCQEGGEQPKV